MGRRDAVQFQLEVAREVIRICPRMDITWEPGWESRGNGTSANFEGGVVHHTASPSSLERPFPTQWTLRAGRTGLPGPLCNWAGPACTVEAPRLHVMAANPANHAGASGGRSMGPLPKTSLFNPVVVGLEIDYAGLVPMMAGQLLAAMVWALAVSRVLGRPSCEWIRAHAETSITGKWDPGQANGRTIDMAAFRRDAWNITDLEDDMPWTDGEWNYIKVMNGKLDRATMAAEGAWQMLAGDLSDGSDRLAEIWKQDGHGDEEIQKRLDAIMTRLNGAPVSGPVAGGQAIQVPTAAEIAAEVVKLQNQQARDGDPATGSVS